VSDIRKQRGQKGEDLAFMALKERNYEILARNFRRAEGEIDIIARKDGCLYFVEVRSKTGSLFGTAAESVGKAKKKQLARMAQIYMAESGQEADCEFMVVAIDFATNELQIIHDMLAYST
jgi:putative endonuclease